MGIWEVALCEISLKLQKVTWMCYFCQFQLWSYITPLLRLTVGFSCGATDHSDNSVMGTRLIKTFMSN